MPSSYGEKVFKAVYPSKHQLNFRW